MTDDQQRETALRLYLACFKTPANAPPPHVANWLEYDESCALTDRDSVSVLVSTHTTAGEEYVWAKAEVDGRGRGFQVRGPIESVEAALASLPDSLKVQP